MQDSRVKSLLFFFLIGFMFQCSPLLARSEQKVDNTQRPEKITVVYYFHTTFRCVTCTNMENWTKEVVETKFKKDIEQGTLKFQAINYESEQNMHFADKYGLSNKHVILSGVESGIEKSWKALDQIWNMVRDKGKFKAYIEIEIKNFLMAPDDKSKNK